VNGMRRVFPQSPGPRTITKLWLSAPLTQSQILWASAKVASSEKVMAMVSSLHSMEVSVPSNCSAEMMFSWSPGM